MALEAYLALGPGRSLEKLHLSQTSTKPLPSVATLKNWSSTFDWVARANAYDAEHLAAERREREQAEAADRQRRHEQRLKDLDSLRPLAEDARDLLKAMQLLKDPLAVVKFFEFIHKSERLEMGEASDRHALSLENMSDADLKDALALFGFVLTRPPP